MMILKRTFALFTMLLFVIVSCKEEKKTGTESTTKQMKEVLAIHDEIMPEIGSFGSLVGDLRSKEDSSEIGMKYKSAREDLQSVHKSMMDWMQDFGNKFDSDEIMNGKELSEEKKKWLVEEEKEIKILKENVERSLKNAKTLLNK